MHVDPLPFTEVPADILDVPQAVQVINAELIKDLGARNVTDLSGTIMSRRIIRS